MSTPVKLLLALLITLLTMGLAAIILDKTGKLR